MKKQNFSDYMVAIVVLFCSAALLGALTYALTGWRHKASGRTLAIDFPDVTGIRIHSELRYAGAPAGEVRSVRLLSAEERLAAPDSQRRNAVRVSILLHEGIPELPGDVRASLASDTLLSEKFVALSAGTPGSPVLADGAILQGIGGGSFDDLLNSLGPIVQRVEETLAMLNPLVKSVSETVQNLQGGVNDVLPRISSVADSVRVAALGAEELLKRADRLIVDNGPGVKGGLDEFKQSLIKLQEALAGVQGFVGNTDKQLAGRMQELSVVLQNLKVATTHAKTFTKAIGEKPSKLIFSGKPNELPPEESILRSLKPVPVR